MKTCYVCSRELPSTEFYANSSSSDGLRGDCKECNNNRNKHGGKPRQYALLFKEQNGHCAICNVLLDKLNLDHCHKTGKRRGLLCRKCNIMLGMCDDNIEILMAAVNYLTIWK